MTAPSAPTLPTLALRVAAVEARLAEVEGGYALTIYKMTRSLVGLQLDLRQLLAQANLTPSTDAEIDEVLDGQS